MQGKPLEAELYSYKTNHGCVSLEFEDNNIIILALLEDTEKKLKSKQSLWKLQKKYKLNVFFLKTS